jgi:L-ribulose-5-phosphate 4-epimerase
MNIEELKVEVLHANQEIVRQGLVRSTFGNVSDIFCTDEPVIIKPSGATYDTLQHGGRAEPPRTAP